MQWSRCHNRSWEFFPMASPCVLLQQQPRTEIQKCKKKISQVSSNCPPATAALLFKLRLLLWEPLLCLLCSSNWDSIVAYDLSITLSTPALPEVGPIKEEVKKLGSWERQMGAPNPATFIPPIAQSTGGTTACRHGNPCSLCKSKHIYVCNFVDTLALPAFKDQNQLLFKDCRKWPKTLHLVKPNSLNCSHLCAEINPAENQTFAILQKTSPQAKRHKPSLLFTSFTILTFITR